MAPIKRPHLRTPTKQVSVTVALDRWGYLAHIAQQQRLGLTAIIRAAIDHYLATHPDAADTQPPASTPDAVSGLAPVSQQGGDDTSTPADSIRDEADPGGPSAEEVPAPEGIAGDVWNG